MTTMYDYELENLEEGIDVWGFEDEDEFWDSYDPD